MGFFDTLIQLGNAVSEEVQQRQGYQMQKMKECQNSDGVETKMGTKTLNEWERSWAYLGPLSSLNLSHLSSSVGLYRAKLNGEIVYLGRAVEFSNGGLRKRLSDYTRESNSGRKHQSGQKMNKNADDLEIEILVTGKDAEAAMIAKKLEPYFIGLYRPEWNKMFNS